MPLPKWLHGAPTLPTIEKSPRDIGSTNFAFTGIMSGAPNSAGPPSPAEIELWRKQRAEKAARGEDPGAVATEKQAKKTKRQEKLKEVFGVYGGKGKEGETLYKGKDEEYHRVEEYGVIR